MFLSYFWSKLRQKIMILVIILCFIYFLCIGIDLVPQKTLITKVKFKFWKNNPGPQADTASCAPDCPFAQPHKSGIHTGL